MVKCARVLLLALVICAAVGSLAQSDDDVIVMGVVGRADELGALDPVTCTNSITCNLANFLFPSFLGVDPTTQTFAPAAPGNSLVTNWEVSPDGTVYTFRMRSDKYWSDGLPVTSRDVLFTYEAMGGRFGFIEDVSAVNQYTVRVAYSQPTCDALWDWNIGILPSHAFEHREYDVFDNPFNLAPTTTSGPFRFGEVNGERLILTADEDYNDTGMGFSALHVVSMPSDEALAQAFLNGQLNYLSVPVQSMDEIRTAPDVDSFEFPGLNWDYVGLNLADPTNPQRGVDSSGKPIDQGHHPIFGDLEVRRALQHGINVRQIIETAALGEAVQMPSNVIPLSWAYDSTLPPVEYNPQAAARLLDSAGWRMGEDGVRVARGAQYAPDGTEMRFTLYTNQGNTRREMAAELIRRQLGDIGVRVDVELVEFDALLDIMDNQTFDAYLLGWVDAFPQQPDLSLFLSDNDSFEGTNNVVSYANPVIDQLFDEIRTVPNCDQGEQISLLHQAQRIIQDEQPYLFLYSTRVMYAARGIDGFNPFRNMPFWNIEDWRIRP